MLQMTTSIAQISANRINAQKSTGAITEAGKKKVSQNALTHGLFSKQLVLAEENSLDYQLLLQQLQQEFSPVGILEQSLVE
jgi:two-component sensor histidine kinase